MPVIKANLFSPLVDSMIKRENYFIKDNLVDISDLVQLGVEVASTPWNKSACGNIEEQRAGMLSTSTRTDKPEVRSRKRMA